MNLYLGMVMEKNGPPVTPTYGIRANSETQALRRLQEETGAEPGSVLAVKLIAQSVENAGDAEAAQAPATAVKIQRFRES